MSDKLLARTTQNAATQAWSWRQSGHGHATRCRLNCWPAEEAMKAQWPGLEQKTVLRTIDRLGRVIARLGK